MIKPTKTGITVLTVGICLYLVSMQAVAGLLFLLLGILFGCLAVNIFKARKATKCLKLTPPESLSAGEGELLKSAWTVENTSSSDIGHIDVISMWGSLLRIHCLESHEVRHITPKLRFNLRGVYQLSEIKLESSYPFGLIKFWRRLNCRGEIVVFPSVYTCNPPTAAGFEPMLGGRFSGKYRSRTGDLFHGVKPFQPQDPVKLIHWRSSSKGLGLMVKEFDEQLSGRVSVILSTNQGKMIDGESTFDWAARAAGSSVLSALDAGFQVEFVNLIDLKLLSIPPFMDGDVVLEALARITPSFDNSSFHNLIKAVSMVSSKSGLSIILTEISSDCIDYLNRISENGTRKLSIYLPSYNNKVTSRDFGNSIAVHYYSKNEIYE